MQLFNLMIFLRIEMEGDLCKILAILQSWFDTMVGGLRWSLHR